METGMETLYDFLQIAPNYRSNDDDQAPSLLFVSGEETSNEDQVNTIRNFVEKKEDVHILLAGATGSNKIFELRNKLISVGINADRITVYSGSSTLVTDVKTLVLYLEQRRETLFNVMVLHESYRLHRQRQVLQFSQALNILQLEQVHL